MTPDEGFVQRNALFDSQDGPGLAALVTRAQARTREHGEKFAVVLLDPDDPTWRWFR